MNFTDYYFALENKFGYGFISGDPSTDVAIAIAEQTIGLSFPKSYRDMLMQCGWLKVLQITRQIWGLGDDLDACENVVQKTLSWRKVTEMQFFKGRGMHPFPSGMIAIGGFEMDIVVLDTNRMSDGECPVIVSEFGSKGMYHECRDFLDYLDYEYLL